MAALDFPASPVDGQAFTSNGITYFYNANIGTWLTQLVNTNVGASSNTQVLFNDAGVANGSFGITFDKGANTVSVNQLVTSGSLGVGTNALGYKLTVRTDNASQTNWIGSVNYSAAGAYGAGVISTVSPTNYSYLYQSGAGNTYLLNYYPGNMLFSTNNATRMMISANGNIGMGYTNMDALAARLYCYGYSGFGASNNGSISLGSRVNWTSTFENNSGGYGLGVNVNAATGVVRLQSQRFDGTATAYDIALQDLGGNVGIGRIPSFKLDVYDATNAYFRMLGDTNVVQQLMRYSTDASSAQFQLYKSRGSSSAPSSVASGDIIGRINFFGYDGTNNLQTAEIRSVVDATPGTGSMPGRLVFYTTADGASTVTERMRITAAGDLLIGQTGSSFSFASNGVNLQPQGRINISSSTDWLMEMGGAITSRIRFYTSAGGTATTVGSISVSTTATTYATSSDYRLKENVKPMTGALEKISLLNPVTFDWNIDNKSGQGFIAHELQKVFPEAVSGEKDGVDKDGNPAYQGVDPSFLVATLVKAVQELKAEIETLKGN